MVAGYIKDFKALSEDMQKTIKTIKRVRVIFGLATLDKPVDEEGKKLNEPYENIPVIFEVDNRTSFKTSGEPFNTLAKRSIFLFSIQLFQDRSTRDCYRS